MKKKTSVFISGGGIGGLTIGLKLAKCGVDVTVVEKLPGPTPVYKGELLQPKSLDILDKLNLLNLTLENGHTIKELDLVEMTSRLKEIDTSVMKYDVIPSDYAYSLMIHHEKIKEIVRDEALKYPHFHYIANSICKGFRENYAIVKKDKKEEIHIEADFFIGAEGRTSATRNEMGINVKESIYNHHFLTVTFPRPKDFTRGKIISTHDRFLGLFPLPNNEVRSVYLIPAGKYKEIRKQSLDYVYKLYTDLVPELEGYVNQIDSWKQIQLMIPLAYHSSQYVQGNKAIIGDAAHTVHPMAGEGMNMAIQDGDVLGELLCDMYGQDKLHEDNLNWFPKVRKNRVKHQMQLSHLSALAYSYPYRPVTWLRRKTLSRIEEDPVLHFKQMLNISGLGIWKESAVDRLSQTGIWPLRTKINQQKKEEKLFANSDDYPWKQEGLV